MVDARTPHGAIPFRHRARHEEVPLRACRIAVHIDLAVQAVMDGEREYPGCASKKTADCVPAYEPTETRAVPRRVLSKKRSDPFCVIVVVAQGRVARLQIADRLSVLEGLEPPFHALKPCQIEGTIPCHCVVLPEKMVPCPVCGVNQSHTLRVL